MDGVPYRSTIPDKQDTLELVGLFRQLMDKALKAIQLFDASNELEMLRIRSRNNEVFITPDKHFVFLVIQGELGQ